MFSFIHTTEEIEQLMRSSTGTTWDYLRILQVCQEEVADPKHAARALGLALITLCHDNTESASDLLDELIEEYEDGLMARLDTSG